jgi:ABC-type sugar transport system ATPase subunit
LPVTDAPLLDVRGLAKRYGGVAALAGAGLVVEAGTVHCLLGENGAGKSTLIKCLAGVVRPDEGEIHIDGRTVDVSTARRSEALGLRFIHQELNLVPHFDAVENCFVGRRYPRRGPFLDRKAMRQAVEPVARRLAPDLPIDRPVARLTTGQRQLVEIIRALVGGPARLIVMDEPTAALSDGEAERLHEAVRALKAQGVAIVFISHRLDEVMALGDAYTVLRGGATVGSGRIGETSKGALVRLMSGHDLREAAAASPVGTGPAVFAVNGLAFGPSGTRIGFQVRSGEIVGLYGLVGSGRSSLLQMLWGARPSDGDVTLDGRRLAPGDIPQRIAAGAAYVPEDRRSQGLVTTRSIGENLAISDLSAVRRFRRLPATSRGRLDARALEIRDRLRIRMGSPRDKPLTLSGGNQQKLLFGRWLGPPVRLLLLDEPSRGVDVSAKAEIHAIVRDFARSGAAILLATSDMDELLTLADRALVLSAGRIVEELDGAALTATAVVAAAFRHTVRTDGSET